MRPLLVSGRGLRCAPADAQVLLDALLAAAEERFTLPEWEGDPDGLLISLRSSGAEWMPRAWVELATKLLSEGTTRVLVGTRALLGEGWNCPPLNVLVDMTVATTGVSVQQMRGRSLRLDPADPEKVASNWDVVCVAPDLTRGSADYERFVRKHLHLFAPAEDGEVEAGPSHVHPELGPFAPPPTERFHALNTELVARATDRAAARERWQIGTPYRGVELPTLLVRTNDGGTIRETGTVPVSRAARASRSGSRSPAGWAARSRSARSASPRARPRCSAGSRSPRPGSRGPRSACARRRSGCRSCCRSTPPRAPSPTPTASSARCPTRPPPRCGSSRARPATCAAS